ncbi:hypothetical protein H6G81_08785 [Scytonema hofmannii FACHB-248]|uniref:Transposase n=1 Tax=Scytonema hofmannii FACHB-248 TaxID=1842502 RepID=A0ABR8GMR0_9CYAN|nr:MULTISPECIES: hypothetical protein [Nostocales]MBD2604623.1 hypothetical protein [Scytonema hofmannii FACHB-248]
MTQSFFKRIRYKKSARSVLSCITERESRVSDRTITKIMYKISFSSLLKFFPTLRSLEINNIHYVAMIALTDKL